MKKILVTGAAGQIGSELTMALRQRYGGSNVVAGIHVRQPQQELLTSGPCEIIDCLDIDAIAHKIKKYNIDTVYHLVAVLSRVGEANPDLAWQINIQTLYNVLEVARSVKCSVFFPSSIGVFGPTTPLDFTPQDTIQRPATIYGVTKVSGELLCDYYHKRFHVDTRGLRYPGLISHATLPGGGTTDYAVEIYYKAVAEKKYTCYLKPGPFLDMMYMPDAVRAAITLMEADDGKLRHRNSFNVSAMSIDPEMIACEIRKHIPEFKIDYQIDPLRQQIADSWPNRMDDSAAREEWNWNPDYDLPAMTREMLVNLKKKLCPCAS